MANAADLMRGLDGLDFKSFSSESDRQSIKNALYAALRRVQIPFEILHEHCFMQPAIVSAIKTLIDAQLLAKWVENGGKPSTASTLAKMCHMDSVLLSRFFGLRSAQRSANNEAARLLRALAGQHFLVQQGPGTFALTAFTESLADEKNASTYSYLFEMGQPVASNFPKFAAKTKYTNPEKTSASNFTDWKGQEPFAYISAHPILSTSFGNAMTVYSGGKMPWPDLYPTDKLVSEIKPDRAIIVDVGGGFGHDLEKFRSRHPDVPDGSLVLQDMPEVVKRAIVKEPCVAVVHDFFEDQPIKGARAYYMHCVLHDWNDEQAIEILRKLAAAMEKGYSRILVHDCVITETGSHPWATTSDLIMMMVVSALERTEGMWRRLVKAAGLRIVKIWSKPESMDSLIEIELP